MCVRQHILGWRGGSSLYPWIYSLSEFISQFFADVTVQEDTGSSARTTGFVASLSCCVIATRTL